MKPLGRRAVLLGGLGLAAGLLGAALGWLRRGPRTPAPLSTADPVAEVLARRLDYLQLDADGVARFAEAHARAIGRSGRAALAAPPADTTARRALEDELVVQYLRSTDFFWNGADESRIVRFTRYHDPYSSACANPFARLS